MRKFISKIVHNKLAAKIFLPIIMKLDNFCYKHISILSTYLNNGLNPKHQIINYHKFFVDNVLNSDEVLDVGCGNGANTYSIAKKAKNVVGIDISKNDIKFARSRYQSENIEYILGDATKNIIDKKFDIVVLSNVLEHIDNRKDFLRKLKNLAPKILIRVPMIDREWIVLYKKQNGIEWRLDSTHFTEYTLESFKKEIEESGLHLHYYSIQFGELWAIVK